MGLSDEAFEERAAILEYCANFPRAEAERQARNAAQVRNRALLDARPSPQSDQRGGLKPCVETALNDMRRLLKQ